MSSRREEEKNEKIIRGLMKLPPNRRCINCNSLGPQYVCTNFWTFVCITCSGIHREFTHRVKSVSMAKFTKPEVEALQSGGNQRAREIFLPDWDFQRTRLPDSSNPDRIREFIRSVYMEKKYAGGRSSDKPPRNIQTQKSFEEDHRRASSYHSYSQSPPYDYQYEDRLYGKQSGMLTRKPGSDRGGFGKISSLIYSPGREQMYEDRFSNEISDPRLSDFSLSSASDSLKPEGQSPNFQKDSPRVSNPQQVRDILIEDGRSQNPKINAVSVPQPQRSASLGSLGSFAEKSVHSEALQPTRSLQRESLISSTQPSFAQLEPTLSSSLDFFTEAPFSSTSLFENPGTQQISAPPVVQQAASLDLFAEINDPPSKPILGNSNPEPFLEKEGWAMFDFPPSGSVFDSKPTSFSQEPSLSVPPNQRNSGTSGIDFSSAATTSQTWNAFDDSSGSFNLSSFETSMSRNEAQLPAHTPSALLQQIDLSFQKGFDTDGLSIPIINDRAAESSSFNPDAHPLGANSHESKSTNPFDISYDSDLEPVKFLDMNPLQATLPSVQFPPPFFDHLGQPSWSSYVSPVGHTGSLPYMAGQPPNSQLADMPSQGPVSSLKGNPFD